MKDPSTVFIISTLICTVLIHKNKQSCQFFPSEMLKCLRNTAPQIEIFRERGGMRSKSRRTIVRLFRTNLIISELEKSGCRIRSRRQYKDQRCTTVGISESFAQIKRRRLNKLFTKLDGNKVLHCGRDLKGEHKINLVFAKGNSKLLKKSLAWHLKEGLAFR